MTTNRDTNPTLLLKKLEKILTMGRVFCYNIRMDNIINGLVGVIL